MFALVATVFALVEGVAVAVAVGVAVAVDTDAGVEGDTPPVPATGEGCVLVDFELTLPVVDAVVPVEALVPDAATAPTFGVVLVAFVTTLPNGCCEVTPGGADPLGPILEGVLVA